MLTQRLTGGTDATHDNGIHICDHGSHWIANTTVKVIDVVAGTLAHGWTAEELHWQFPHLTLGQIEAAIRHFRYHQSELDSRIHGTLEAFQRAAASTSDSPLRSRLRLGGTPIRNAGLYMDPMVPAAITRSWPLRNADVVSAHVDGSVSLSASQRLDRATCLGRVLVSLDVDTWVEAQRRIEAGDSFGGLVYAHPMGLPIGTLISSLQLLSEYAEPDDFSNRIELLPL